MTGRITNQANQYGKDVEAYQVVAYLIQCLGNMFFYRLFTDFHLGGYFFIPQVLFAACRPSCIGAEGCRQTG